MSSWERAMISDQGNLWRAHRTVETCHNCGSTSRYGFSRCRKCWCALGPASVLNRDTPEMAAALARLQDEVWSRFGVEVVPLKRVLPADLRSPEKLLARYERKADKRARKLGFASAGDRYARDSLYRRDMATWT
jgi:hypothetical protein